MRFAVCMLLLTVSLFPGCGSDHRSFTVADPWLRLPPMEFILASDQKEISTDNFAVVTRKEAEALARLEESPCAKLSPQEAEAFLGKPFAEAGGQLVLLRGLSLNEPTGAFSITWLGGEVRVHHGCLGRHPSPMTRRALVARLPGLPAEVYVDCSMIE